MKRNILELTGLRGLAALCIIINHTVLVVPYLKKFPTVYFSGLCGHIGMSLFFILSGIVVYYNYSTKIVENPKKEIFNFFIARFARLYPLYFLFLLSFFIYNLSFSYYREASQLSANIVALPIFFSGMQSWFYGFINGIYITHLQGSANISWSISTEFALYFCFIPFVFLLKNIKTLKGILLLFLLSIGMKFFWMHLVYRNDSLVNMLEYMWPNHVDYARMFLGFHSPISRFFEFITGCSLAMFYIKKDNMQGEWIYLKLISAILCFVGVIALIGTVFKLYMISFEIYGSMILAFCCLGIVIFDCKILTSKFLLFIGEVSYSAYLLHMFVLLQLQYTGSRTVSICSTIFFYIIITYFVAWCSFKYLETPLRKMLRDICLKK